MENIQLEKAKDLFQVFLYFDLEKSEFAPLIVNHPIFESAYLFDGKELFDATLDEERLNKYRRSYMDNVIKNADSIIELVYFVRKSYRLTFLKFLLNEGILPQKDISNLLAQIWINLENVNHDVNVKKDMVLRWIKKADKQVLMNEDEINAYDSLGDYVTIYRGSVNKKGYKGICWTLDKGTAEWFAKRFHNEGYVHEATIKKEDIIAVLNGRNEKELIVDYNKLINVRSFDVS